MPAPTTLTNYQKVMRCVEYLLQQINNANGYYTNGLMVERGGDPTNFVQDHKEEWFDKMAAAGIVPGDDDDSPKGIGNISRYAHTYAIMCMMELTDAQRESGLRLDDLRSRLVWDIKRAIRGDYKLQQAATALEFPISNPNDGLRVSCIHHHIPFVRGDEGMNFPTIKFVVGCQFEDIENIDAVV